MKDFCMDRKEFLASIGKWTACSCLCAAMGGLHKVFAQDIPDSTSIVSPNDRAVKRIEFAENWIRRFMNALDSTLDEETKKKVMMANGKICFQEWIKSTGQEIKPLSLKQLSARIKDNVKDDSIRIEGNVIYYQFMSAAETGQAAPEGACLCPLVESKPAGLSSTYCLCSVGYVKEWHDQLLQKSVDVELVDSVLNGGKRCKFKITVP